MCWRWRVLDLSWHFHCSHNSLIGPHGGSYPSGVLPTFVIEITHLIYFLSISSSISLSEPDLKSPEFNSTPVCVSCHAWTCVYLTAGLKWLQAETQCFCDSSGDYAHLLYDTDGDDRAAGVPRGQRALSSSATWQRLASRSKEVSLLICVNEVTTLQGQATTRTHILHSRQRYSCHASVCRRNISTFQSISFDSLISLILLPSCIQRKSWSQCTRQWKPSPWVCQRPDGDGL